MIDFKNLTAKELCSNDVINEIMDEKDPVTREQMKFNLQDRAAEFGKRYESRVIAILKTAENDLKERSKNNKNAKTNTEFERMTDFGGKYPDLKCGQWVADGSGVFNPNKQLDQKTACRHPILPIEIITNVETNERKVKLAYRLRNRWYEQIVSKYIIADKGKITQLAKIGIDVTSEQARNLVCYLSDVETLNFDNIPEIMATAKMGWCEDGFMPYTSELIFDRDGNYDILFDTVTNNGSRQKWMDLVLAIRKTGRVEPRLALAASLASVLLKPCNLLPFWVDFWGATGRGKSVCGMLAASIWANPEIGKYIYKADNTKVSFEVMASVLNHLPFIMDDTAEIRKKLKDDFTQIIYSLAAGVGKGRSNVNLGLVNVKTWKNVIICSGETPIITEQLQGGAVNRIIEFECDEGEIFENGKKTASILLDNYGFIGKEFVEIISKLGFQKVAELQDELFELIKNEKYESKQLLSLTAILLADQIATHYIFKDDMALKFADIEKTLVDKDTLSENERCYSYIISECDINRNKFLKNYYGDYSGEVWGKYISEGADKTPCIAIVSNAFKRICASGGYSPKAFISWALKKNLMFKGKDGKASKVVKIDENPIRCYVFKLPDTDEEEE